MIYRDLISNVALLLALLVLYGLLVRRRSGDKPLGRIMKGVLFGTVAVAGMVLPFRYSPGVIFDGRSIVISLGGLFGGPPAAAVAALIASGYRLSLGGAGALTGVAVIVTSAALGAAGYLLRRKGKIPLNPLSLFGFGLLVQFTMLAWLLTLPGDLPFKVLGRITRPVILIFPAATVLLGLLFQAEEKRMEAQKTLRESRERLRGVVEERTTELEKRISELDRLNRGMVNLVKDFQAVNRGLERTARELEEANQELEAFAYSAAHDLRAPLRAIEGYTRAVIEDCDGKLEESGREYLERTICACSRMRRLIDDLLYYSRLNRMDISLKPVYLQSVLENSLEDLRAKIREKQAEISVKKPLPAAVANRTILTQGVKNLILNALTFTSAGVIPRIEVRASRSGSVIRLEIEDNGIGIRPEDGERVFQIFERLHGVETYPGTGIGLAIARRGIERMGGKIGFRSRPGEGSVFWIELPAVKDEQ